VRRGLRRAEDLMPGTGSRVQSRGDSDKLALNEIRSGTRSQWRRGVEKKGES